MGKPRARVMRPPQHSAEILAVIAHIEKEPNAIAEHRGMRDDVTRNFFHSPHLHAFWKSAERALDQNLQHKELNAHILCNAFLVPYWRGYAGGKPQKSGRATTARGRDDAAVALAKTARIAAVDATETLVRSLEVLLRTPGAQAPGEAMLLRAFSGQLLEPMEYKGGSLDGATMEEKLENLARAQPPATLIGALLLLADKLKQPLAIRAPHMRSQQSSWRDWLRCAVDNLQELSHGIDACQEYAAPFMPRDADWVRLVELFSGREQSRRTVRGALEQALQEWRDSQCVTAPKERQT